MRNRAEEIKAKGFNIVAGDQRAIREMAMKNTGYNATAPIDYSKIKVGLKTLDDAILQLGDLKKANPRLADKQTVLKAIQDKDYETMREISNYFYRVSGIYNRALRYMAFMYRYDWFVSPFYLDEGVSKDKISKVFYQQLKTLDDFQVKKKFGEIALAVLRNGCYYGYKVEQNGKIVIQELPVNYCRSRFFMGNKPAVEFNMKYFDDAFKDTVIRDRVLKMFPPEFMKGYRLYKQGKLPPEAIGETGGWYLLDPTMTVKFNANGEDYPAFISAIPLILDLDAAQELDRKKTMQKLLKIIIQKMPLDKDGELIFDVDEAQQLHNNAVQMLQRAIGVDVLTTFADVEVADMSDSRGTSQTDDLQKVERQVYNEFGIAQNQFNSDGNIALEKSELNDEATMYNLLLQFEDFLNELISVYNKSKKIEFKAQLLTTTQYNYKELSKMYKDQVSLGYSKMLPPIALGQSQSSILATAYFENEVLDLAALFIPPMQSSVMNADAMRKLTGKDAGAGQSGSDESKGGRPTNEELGKPASDKTLQNKESQS